ncbi:hypothetical protein PkP19E3_33815 (plasmid) [Pseudomonas koreensis]|nr:hypothetical protein PkP19E3_33815 [Pseudomonas koreensis]
MDTRAKQNDAHPKVTPREMGSAFLQVAPVATVVFAVPFIVGYFAKLSDHMTVAKWSLCIALVGGAFLLRKRKKLHAALMERAIRRMNAPGN